MEVGKYPKRYISSVHNMLVRGYFPNVDGGTSCSSILGSYIYERYAVLPGSFRERSRSRRYLLSPRYRYTLVTVHGLEVENTFSLLFSIYGTGHLIQSRKVRISYETKVKYVYNYSF